MQARFSLSPGGLVEIAYSAICDQPTICSLTNHNVYNLSGSRSQRSIREHIITLAADCFLPVNESLIPTGERRSVERTPFDLRRPRQLGSVLDEARDEQIRIAHGIDQSFVLAQQRREGEPDASLSDPVSGRRMELRTTSPAIQVYSGNFLTPCVVGKRAGGYRPHDGICLEPQQYPNAPNTPSFPSARLAPGDVYRNAISLRLSTSA